MPVNNLLSEKIQSKKRQRNNQWQNLLLKVNEINLPVNKTLNNRFSDLKILSVKFFTVNSILELKKTASDLMAIL